MRLRAVLLCACVFLGPSPVRTHLSAVPQDPQAALSTVAQRAEVDGVTRLVRAIEYAIQTGDAAALRALARHDVNRSRLADFVQTMTATKVAQITLKERDRATLDSGSQRLLLEILTVQKDEGRVSTWRLDAAPA